MVWAMRERERPSTVRGRTFILLCALGPGAADLAVTAVATSESDRQRCQ